MGNKIWTALLCFGSFVFATLACFAIWIAIREKSLTRPLVSFFWMSFLAYRSGKLAVSRIRYGPKGPPPDPLANFRVDF
jgi:hypothetical protein